MRCLTLTQPYATLIAIGAKTIETRSWYTGYRGPLAIHAAAGLGPVGGLDGLADLLCEEPFKSVLGALIRGGDRAAEVSDARPDWITTERLPRGAIVAVCDLVNCWPTSGDGYEATVDDGVISFNHWHKVSDQERAFGDYTLGRFAWLLANIRALPTPIPAKGALGLWNWESEARP